jgi:hypothetical protein
MRGKLQVKENKRRKKNNKLVNEYLFGFFFQTLISY